MKSDYVFTQMKHRLITNIAKEFKLNEIESKITEIERFILIETKNNKTKNILKRTFGIHSFSFVEEFSDINDAKKICKEMASKWKKTSFAIRTKRTDKKYEYTSRQINEILGKQLTEMGFKVDLKNPEKEIFVHIGDKKLIYSEKIDGPGGMPLKKAKIFSFLEDEKDLLATWLLMKRGAMPYFDENSNKDLLKYIDKWSVGKEIGMSLKEDNRVVVSSETDIEKIKKLKKENEKFYIFSLVGLSKSEINKKIDFIKSF